MMPEGNTLQRTHLNCVICGKAFNSVFSEALNTYPVFHPQNDDVEPSCEIMFYQIVIRIYNCLHTLDSSMQLSELLDKISWDHVQLRKETLLFCLKQGYLIRDNLKRIIIPPALHEITKDIFKTENLHDSYFQKKAVDYIKSALIVMRDQLPKEKKEEIVIPEKNPLQIPENRRLHRMATIDRILTKKEAIDTLSGKSKRMYSR